MNDSQSNRLDMYIVVNDYYLTNKAVIDEVPARTVVFERLAHKIADINIQIAWQSSNTTGVAQDKTAHRNTLDAVTMSLLAPALSWAVSVGNNTLVAEFNYSLSDVQRIKDDTIQGFCTHRLNLINSNISDMADFGILPPALVQWQAAIDAYTAILESPREAINARHINTQNLKILFKETSDLLHDQADPLMIPLKTTNPELYAGYKQARIIINRSGPSTPTPPDTTTATLFGIVTNQVGGTPLQGASVAIISETTASPIAVTDINGAYRLEDVQPGEYPVQCTLNGFIPFNTTVLLEAGAEFELNIALQ